MPNSNSSQTGAIRSVAQGLILAVIALSCPQGSANPLCRDSARAIWDSSTLVAGIRNGTQTEKKVHVLTPTYREWESGNLLRLLESFAGQTAHPNQFEMVFLVNNSKEAYEKKNEAYQDNQRSLTVLRYLADRTGTLSPEARELFAKLPAPVLERIEALKKKGLNIVVMDKTRGVERNMGKVRAALFDEVAGRNPGRLDHTITAWMDGDAQVPLNYIEHGIVNLSGPHPVQALFYPIDLKVEPGSPREVYQSTHDFRYEEFTREQMECALRGECWVSGPQLMAKASGIKSVGGPPHDPDHENNNLANTLEANVPHRNPSDMTIVFADRARPDGYYAAIRHGDLGGEKAKKSAREIEDDILRSLASRALQNLREEHPEALTDSRFRKLMDFYGFQIDEKAWKRALASTPSVADAFDHYFDDERSFESHPRKGGETGALVDFLRARMDTPERQRLDQALAAAKANHEASANELRSAIQSRIQQIAAGQAPHHDLKTEGAKEFLVGNVWIDDEIQADLKRGLKTNQILAKMERDFPDWLNPWEKTPLKGLNTTLNALGHLFREAHERPADYPLLKRLSDLEYSDLSVLP